jgi:membrane-associated protein
MDLLKDLLDFVLHIDKHLADIVGQYRETSYLILGLIIFIETGLVVMPFLPGDSLLFAAGTLAGIGLFNIWLLILILFIAAFTGDNLNFSIGKYTGQRLVNSRWIKKEYLQRTHDFYEKHGGKTVIIARFIPIVRTFAPFVAGLGTMKYGRFLTFCIAGNLIWILSFTFAGYALGNNEWVKNNFSLVTFGIIGLSALPVVIGVVRTMFSKKKSA